ncbi:MAG: LysR family transcriptional regulator [Ruminococcaceae bacterium]|nr:LysR family transcriptional regulator [Oscillospiraceae bacterium]
MLLRQIEYFQSVVRNNNFTLAAEEHHISQSAISQQIKALENELGAKLLERKNRRFTLTEAGEHFYKRSLVITADLEQLCRETVRLDQKDAAALSVGFLISYDGDEFTRAIAAFSEAYPAVTLNVMSGNHEDLYDALRFGRIDLALNDQRRAFSDEYENHILAESVLRVEMATHNPLSQLAEVEIADLRRLPCILVASKEQQEEERRYYRDIVGFKGEFLFAETLQEARVMAVSNRGVLPVEGRQSDSFFGATLRRVPLTRGGSPIRRTYCAFWKKDNANPYVRAFYELLKGQFT